MSNTKTIPSVTDKQIIKLFRRYERRIHKNFSKRCAKEGFIITEKTDYVGLLDEMFSEMCSEEFAEQVIESINDSIGMEEYGLFFDYNA